MGVKVLKDFKGGRLSDVIKGIRFVKAMKKEFEPNTTAWVVNNSYGVLCDTSCPSGPQSLEDEIKSAPDLLFVASAGNDGIDTNKHPHFPSSFRHLDNLISVAAITKGNMLWGLSNFGETTVDIGAPGEAICSCALTESGGRFSYKNGTSMAAPFVSGAAALMLSNCGSLTPQSLKKLLLDNTDPIDLPAGKPIAHGRLNVLKAIRACRS
jgi:subtilisin family serine protease